MRAEKYFRCDDEKKTWRSDKSELATGIRSVATNTSVDPLMTVIEDHRPVCHLSEVSWESNQRVGSIKVACLTSNIQCINNGVVMHFDADRYRRERGRKRNTETSLSRFTVAYICSRNRIHVSTFMSRWTGYTIRM